MRWMVLLLVMSCGLASAQGIPTDEEAFTKLAAERVGKELPEYKIAPAGSLTLEGKRADGESTGTLSLDRVHAFCVRNAAQCESALDHYSKAIAEFVTERNRPIEPDMVRLVVRPAEYADQLRKQVSAGGATIYAHAVAPGLVSIPVLDFSRSVRFVNEKDLAKLALTEQQAFALGETNLRSHGKPFAEVAPVPHANSFGQIAEDYATSRILMHDDWRSMSSQLNGALIVLMPDPSVLLYGDGSTRGSVAALRAYAADIARKSTHPLPLVMLKWTDAGWDVVD